MIDKLYYNKVTQEFGVSFDRLNIEFYPNTSLMMNIETIGDWVSYTQLDRPTVQLYQTVVEGVPTFTETVDPDTQEIVLSNGMQNWVVADKIIDATLLTELRTFAKDKITQKRKETEVGGLLFPNGVSIKTSKKDQDRILSVIINAERNGIEEIDFKADSGWVKISIFALKQIAKELIYWIQAAERADSVGVDVINTSLGYTEFDDPRYDYKYADMDGKTTLISQGAEVGASRGILLVNAAGNEGNDPWKMISAPADAKNVFTIGANDSSKNPADFTSFGPNAGGILKPNVSALGQNIVVYLPSGSLTYSNGTSFASPVTAGAMAVILQKFPKVPLENLKDNVQKSAHLFGNPTYQLGYGIPNYEKANQELLAVSEVSTPNQLKIYPNPFKDELHIQSNNEIKMIEIYNLVGQKLIRSINQKSISTTQLKSGMYLIKVTDNKGITFTEKVIKK